MPERLHFRLRHAVCRRRRTTANIPRFTRNGSRSRVVGFVWGTSISRPTVQNITDYSTSTPPLEWTRRHVFPALSGRHSQPRWPLLAKRSASRASDPRVSSHSPPLFATAIMSGDYLMPVCTHNRPPRPRMRHSRSIQGVPCHHIRHKHDVVSASGRNLQDGCHVGWLQRRSNKRFYGVRARACILPDSLCLLDVTLQWQDRAFRCIARQSPQHETLLGCTA